MLLCRGHTFNTVNYSGRFGNNVKMSLCWVRVRLALNGVRSYLHNYITYLITFVYEDKVCPFVLNCKQVYAKVCEVEKQPYLRNVRLAIFV